MKRIYGYMLGFSSLFMINMVYAQSTCVEPPSCGSIGYNEISKDCSSGAIKCPWDISKVFCLKLPKKIEKCNVGDILYSDKSCSKTVVIGKTAIAIVFDKNKKLAVALEQAPKELSWGVYEDVLSLTNCSSEPFTCGMDSKANTDAIIAYGKLNSITYPAAEYCSKYATIGTKAGDWVLPSFVDLKNIYNARIYVNASLKLLGKLELTKDYYWSSNEKDQSKAWVVNMNYDNSDDMGKSIKYFVRPIMSF